MKTLSSHGVVNVSRLWMWNALDATKGIKAPEVKILLAVGDEAVITVRDNGTGIEIDHVSGVLRGDNRRADIFRELIKPRDMPVRVGNRPTRCRHLCGDIFRHLPAIVRHADGGLEGATDPRADGTVAGF